MFIKKIIDFKNSVRSSAKNHSIPRTTLHMTMSGMSEFHFLLSGCRPVPTFVFISLQSGRIFDNICQNMSPISAITYQLNPS